MWKFLDEDSALLLPEDNSPWLLDPLSGLSTLPSESSFTFRERQPMFTPSQFLSLLPAPPRGIQRPLKFCAPHSSRSRRRCLWMSFLLKKQCGSPVYLTGIHSVRQKSLPQIFKTVSLLYLGLLLLSHNAFFFLYFKLKYSSYIIYVSYRHTI